MKVTEQAVTSLFEPGSLVEVRAKSGKGMVSLYFDDPTELVDAVETFSTQEDTSAVYYTLNPIKREILSEEHRNIQLNSWANYENEVHGSTRDGDIEKLVNLLIDCDPVRPANLNATKEEKAHALDLLNKVYEFLSAQGWPEPIVGDSGNGYHLVYRVNQANNDVEVEIRRRILHALGNQFDTPEAKVDRAVFNPSRITKAYGTWTRKGENTEERPWRKSKLLQVPEQLIPVPDEQLIALAETVPPEPKHERENLGFSDEFDFEEFAQHYGLEFHGEPKTWKDGELYTMTVCPFKGEAHSGPIGSTKLFVGDGTLGFKCHGCENGGNKYSIGDFLRKLNEDHEPYPHEIWPEREGFDVDDALLEELDATMASEMEALPTREPLDLNDEDPAPSEVCYRPNCNCGLEHKTLEATEVAVSEDDLTAQLLAVVLLNPSKAFGDFVFYRKRLHTCVKVLRNYTKKKEKPFRALGEALEAVLLFEDEFHRLPTREDLTAFVLGSDLVKDKSTVIAVVQELPEVAEGLSLDPIAQRLVKQCKVLEEDAILVEAIRVLRNKGLEEARTFLAQQRQESLDWGEVISSQRYSFQENLDLIYDEWTRERTAEEIEKQVLTLRTGFPTVDEALGNQTEERWLSIVGAASNYKTSLAVHLAFNSAMTKEGGTLFVIGEHLPKVVDERWLQLYLFVTGRCRLTPEDWKDGRATSEDKRLLREAKAEIQERRAMPGFLMAKQASEFGFKLENVFEYMERTHEKYQWRCLVIDPFEAFVQDGEDKYAESERASQMIVQQKTNYHNQQGLVVLTTFQLAPKDREELKKAQDKKSSLHDYESILRRKVKWFSWVDERSDMAWGVAQHGNRKGRAVVIHRRDRHGHAFEPFCLRVDRISLFMKEVPKVVEAAPMGDVEEM